MNMQNEVDFNDLMFDLNDEPRQVVVSISSDSNLADSISGYGLDANAEEVNEQYIEQNRQPRELIRAEGISNGRVDSGLCYSISKTRTSEFIPEIIEIRQSLSSNSTSVSFKGNVSQLEENSDSDYTFEDLDDKIDDGNCSEEFVSSFDLALSKKYREQAKIYYDDTMEKGLKLKTNHVKTLKEIVNEKNIDSIVKQVKSNKMNINDQFEEYYYSSNFATQQAKMLQMDFQNYLELMNENRFKEILQKINKKYELNNPEKIIKRNVKSKETRYALKNETIELIENEIKRYECVLKQLENLQKADVLRKKLDICRKLVTDENLDPEKRQIILKQVEELENELNRMTNS